VDSRQEVVSQIGTEDRNVVGLSVTNCHKASGTIEDRLALSKK
jgi:hypothetical protein